MKIVSVLLMLYFLFSTAFADTGAPEGWEEEVIITSNSERAPEEIQNMLDDPPIVAEKAALLEKKSLWETCGKSALFPGLGHYYIESYNRAFVLAGVEAALIYGVLTSDPTNFLDQSDNTIEVIKKQRESLTMLAGLVWVWGIFDSMSLAIEHNRLVEVEQKRFSWHYREGIVLTCHYAWE